MRENIGLYRGKRIDNDEWIEGCLVKKIDPMLGVGYCFILAQEYDTSCIDGQPTHLNSFMTWYKVDPETVGECSGILDRANVFIFEGDILKIRYLCQKPVMAVVKFTNGKFTARYVRNGKEYIDNLTATASSLYKIIGNIHDNPELLGGNSP